MNEALFSPKLLTDEALLSTQTELARKKGIAIQLGGGAMVAQLDVMIAAIEQERMERMALDRQRLVASDPVVIETDQRLRASEHVPDAAEPMRSASGRTPRRPIRSTKPQL